MDLRYTRLRTFAVHGAFTLAKVRTLLVAVDGFLDQVCIVPLGGKLFLICHYL
jgi:hypothetical protein